MILPRFRSECPMIYSSALAEAKRLHHSYIGVEHISLALLGDLASSLTVALRQIGIDVATLTRAFEKEVGTGESNSNPADATPRLLAILTIAAAEGGHGPFNSGCNRAGSH